MLTVFHALSLWSLAVVQADRDTLRLLADVTRVAPWWGRVAAAIVRAGPPIAVLLWLVDTLLLPTSASRLRAAHVRALASAMLAGLGWAVAWAVVPLASYPAGFSAAAAGQAAASALPLGGALLALGVGDGGTAAGGFLRIVVIAYALARLAIGADGPLRVVAEAVSALAATLLLARAGALEAALDAMARRLAAALGLDGRGGPEPGGI